MEYGRKKIVIGDRSARKGEWPGRLTLVSIALVCCLAVLLVGYLQIGSEESTLAVPPPVPSLPADLPFERTVGVTREASTFRQILEALKIDPQIGERLLSSSHLLSGRTLRAGAVYRIEYGPGEGRPVRNFTIEVDDTTLVKLHFLPYARLETLRREVSEREVHYAGLITRNFWLSILENDTLHHSLIPIVEEALKWTVDLFHLGPGDRFKLIYREVVRDGQSLGVSQVEAIRIQTAERTYNAFSHPVGDSVVYLDFYGGGLQRRFLRAPVRFGIVSSPFSRARVHPVTGQLRRHGGTDFAAPRGSPIYALADGEVSRVGQDANNGKYLELWHDVTHSTMYLHMDDFVPELTRGKGVRQGQVIGYVGATGLATGPHVCLRFRIDGKEEDFLRFRDEKFEAYVRADLDGFFERRDSLTEILERLSYDELIF